MKNLMPREPLFYGNNRKEERVHIGAYLKANNMPNEKEEKKDPLYMNNRRLKKLQKKVDSAVYQLGIKEKAVYKNFIAENVEDAYWSWSSFER